MQTEQDKKHEQRHDQLIARCQNERKTKDKQSKRSPLLMHQNTVKHVNDKTQTNIRGIEYIEKADSSEKTLELTSRWK